MVIKSLIDLYETLLSQNKVAPEGWDKAKINYRIILTPDGTIKEIKNIMEKVERGKKTITLPTLITLPKAVIRTSGKKANFLWDKASYIFGYDKTKPKDAELCFNIMRKKHHQILDNCPSKLAQTLLAYFDTWNSTNTTNSEIYKNNPEIFDDKGNYAFAVNTGNEILNLEEDTEIKKAWKNYLEESNKTTDAVYGTCAITGKTNQKIATIHPKIKGIVGSDSSGSSLICFNTPSVCSYGHDGEQALNSHISEYASTAYTKALNWLLQTPEHHTSFGNVTVVYWTEHNKNGYGDYFETILYPTNDKETNEEQLDKVMGDIRLGRNTTFNNDELNPNETFYILGLGSSGARASIRFFLKDSFGEMLQNIYKHQERLMIERPEKIKTISLWSMLQATIRKGSTIPAPLVDTLFRCIIYNHPYPASLYINVLQRIYLDKDDDTAKTKKVNYLKAGIIKAYLIKNSHYDKEILNSVALNTENNEVPYLLGRLFAILESVQRNALPNINATIKDKYFNSACRTPSKIYPLLLKLSNAHQHKLQKPLALYFKKKISDIVEKINNNPKNHGFPVQLNNEEQGLFMLGYYQELENTFKKAKEKRKEKEENIK